ncbi:MAG: phosphate ABC transporter permease subunit PstC [Actinobacteria bacterium]|nr:phosphate ABC transporter permease subunit PstC [Actinomycetota bacterium]
MTAAAFFSLIVLSLIAFFLVYQSLPAIRDQGLINFLTGTEWDSKTTSDGTTTEDPVFGVAAMLWGTILIAIIAIVIGLPVSLGIAVFIVFIASARLATLLRNTIDFLAAIPSIVFGLWAISALTPVGKQWGEWLTNSLGFIPIFENNLGIWVGTPFIAGIVLAVMVTPIITSVSREVLGRTPPELINASQALGGTLWPTLRYVAFPFAKSGIVAATMLGLGRALGETVAVFYVLNLTYGKINWYQIVSPDGGSIASLIVAKFSEADPLEISALLGGGMVLFIITLIVNAISTTIARSTVKDM